MILAIGQAADLSFLSAYGQVKCERGLITVNPESQETGMPGIFAGRVVGKGPGAIIDAIAAGSRAAVAMDTILGGDGLISETHAEKPDTHSYTGARDRGFADLVRVTIPHLPLDERIATFKEVDLCFNDEQAIIEAKRCLQCDLEIRMARAYRV